MFLIFFLLSQFSIPSFVQVAVGLVGGFLMVFMGIQTFRNRHKSEETQVKLEADSVLQESTQLLLMQASFCGG